MGVIGLDNNVGPDTGRDVDGSYTLADDFDGREDEVELSGDCRIVEVGVELRVLGNGDGLALGREVGQLLIQFFSQEGHHRVQQSQGCLQHVEQSVSGQLH